MLSIRVEGILLRSMTKQEVERRSGEEREWWNRFADIMSVQWEMTPALNKVLRQGLTKDYDDFLFLKNGRLLDVGCGNGWISAYFAQKGMDVLGIDFSEKQIALCNAMKKERGISNLEFRCVNIVAFDPQEIPVKFDSIMINAFLHHLTAQEINQVLRLLGGMLQDGGRVYVYEPIEDRSKGYTSLLSLFCYYFIRYSLGLFFYRPIEWFNLDVSDFRRRVQEGYTGISPHEGPIALSVIAEGLADQKMRIVDVVPWHSVSLGFGMRVTMLRRNAYRFYKLFTPLVYGFDRCILRRRGWQSVSTLLMVMCGIKIMKLKE
jgi:2-polyprenyl-3-methyl-5-hydroxy-6-metoxy-1,4-benzoquinol methylase